MDINTAPILTDSGESPFVLFSLDGIVYGVSSSHVLSIEILHTPTPVVNAPDYTLGLLDFRGDMILLLSLRKLFGRPVRGDGRRRAMQRNHADHEKWMNELEEAVLEGRRPDISFNPDTCTLGKWIGSFKTKSHSLKIHVNKMVVPHRMLHETGARAVELAVAGERDEAIKLVHQCRSEYYNELIELIDATADVYLSGVRDMLLVLNVNDVTKGIVVDDLVSVEYIDTFIGLPGNKEQSKYIKSLAKRNKVGTTVQLIDEGKIIAL